MGATAAEDWHDRSCPLAQLRFPSCQCRRQTDAARAAFPDPAIPALLALSPLTKRPQFALRRPGDLPVVRGSRGRAWLLTRELLQVRPEGSKNLRRPGCRGAGAAAGAERTSSGPAALWAAEGAALTDRDLVRELAHQERARIPRCYLRKTVPPPGKQAPVNRPQALRSLRRPELPNKDKPDLRRRGESKRAVALTVAELPEQPGVLPVVGAFAQVEGLMEPPRLRGQVAAATYLPRSAAVRDLTGRRLLAVETLPRPAWPEVPPFLSQPLAARVSEPSDWRTVPARPRLAMERSGLVALRGPVTPAPAVAQARRIDLLEPRVGPERNLHQTRTHSARQPLQEWPAPSRAQWRTETQAHCRMVARPGRVHARALGARSQRPKPGLRIRLRVP